MRTRNRDLGRGAFKFLIENGPTIFHEMPNTPHFRNVRHGVQAFQVTLGGTGQVASAPEKPERVYYIQGTHDPQDVVDVWAENHQKTIEEAPDRAIHRNTPKKFREAMLEYIEPDYGKGERPGGGGDCPICGEYYVHSLPYHMQNDCEI